MEKMKRDVAYTSVIGMLLVAFGVVACFYYLERSSRTETAVSTGEETDMEEEDEVTIVHADMGIEIVAALVWWDQDEGFRSIKRDGAYITTVTPFWYELTEDGHIDTFSGAEDTEVLGFLNDNDFQVLPILSNEFERLPAADIIADYERMSEHVDDIVVLVTSHGYAGISLNYENLEDTDRGRFSDFVALLADELHAKDKKLMVHVHAKTSEPGTWNGPQSQDWVAIGEAADAVKIMAYDYHWSTSGPGAIAPITWVEDVVAFAVSVIPPEKVYLGIGLYGYDWGEAEEAESLTYADAINLLEREELTAQFDDAAKSPFFTYAGDDGVEHEVWFENAASFSYKMELVNEYGLGGISLFRLGDEDTGIYDVLAGDAYAGDGATGQSPQE